MSARMHRTDPFQSNGQRRQAVGTSWNIALAGCVVDSLRWRKQSTAIALNQQCYPGWDLYPDRHGHVGQPDGVNDGQDGGAVMHPEMSGWGTTLTDTSQSACGSGRPKSCRVLHKATAEARGVPDRTRLRYTLRHRHTQYDLPRLLSVSVYRRNRFAQLNTWPAHSPVEGSSPLSRAAAQGSAPWSLPVEPCTRAVAGRNAGEWATKLRTQTRRVGLCSGLQVAQKRVPDYG